MERSHCARSTWRWRCTWRSINAQITDEQSKTATTLDSAPSSACSYWRLRQCLVSSAGSCEQWLDRCHFCNDRLLRTNWNCRPSEILAPTHTPIVSCDTALAISSRPSCSFSVQFNSIMSWDILPHNKNKGWRWEIMSDWNKYNWALEGS